MSILVHCPGGHSIRIKAKYAGQTGRCPRCGARIEVPSLLSDNEIDSVLNDFEEDHSVRYDPGLEKHLESSGISLVGSKAFSGPIKSCPKCKEKVHVPANNVCPKCAAYFTHW